MGQVVSFKPRVSVGPVEQQIATIDLPEFENMFLSNLVVRLDVQGFASLARAIADSVANLAGSTCKRVELDGLVDLGLKFLAPASGPSR
ncbi:MAG: hypothetical protein ABI459_02670 [Deltaproteobacteria bacterium]